MTHPATGNMHKDLLRSGSLEVSICNGAVSRIRNILSGEIYDISDDHFSITTSLDVFHSRGLAPEEIGELDGVLSYRFRHRDIYSILLSYCLAANGEFIERWIEIEDLRAPLDLLKIAFSWASPETPPREFVEYETFWNTPTALFLRWPNGGLFAGIENPFFRVEEICGGPSFSYEPFLILIPGDTYQSDPQYLGVYSRSGRVIADHYLPTLARDCRSPRFRNPSGHIPLDWNEIQAMRRFALAHLKPRLNQFTCALYMYWYPIEQLWKETNESHPEDVPLERTYKQIVENFAELGGDLLIFNPLFPYKRPGSDPSSYWDVAPVNSSAGSILAFAQEKGIDCGFYMGVAAHGHHGNAAALPFADEERDWKKVDLAGATSGENCIACRDYADWWYAVQRNTISRFNLKFWSWDPGPGHGSFCYSRGHGHVPGKGAYKGWREANRLTARLKTEFPDLKLLAFYGRKECGLWGLKNFDLHESYWEQTILYGATKHSDLHDDRINADGSRYQNWWNENFRFLPTAMNHALVHRIGENSYDSRLPKAWDMLGWRYSLMSAIASSGSAVACILPENLENVPGFVAFYKKWLQWARDNFEYLQHNVTLGDQVRPGGLDIYARVRDDHGYIFLCNPGPRPARAQLVLDSSLGLNVDGRFTLRELYPSSNRLYFDTDHHRGIFATRETISVTVPAHEVCLFELERFNFERLPLIFGVDGRIEGTPEKIVVEDMLGQPGERADLILLAKKGQSPPDVVLNGRMASLSPAGDYRGAAIQFAGQKLPRALDNWSLPTGELFSFPYHEAFEALDLETDLFCDASIQSLLADARPANLSEYEDLLDGWKEMLPHTFTWARPDRLWLALPFTNASHVAEVGFLLNGRSLPIKWFAPKDRSCSSRVIAYADLTDDIAFGSSNRLKLRLLALGANQFLGPYLDYPPQTPVTSWAPAGEAESDTVIYTRPVDRDMPTRIASAGERAPRVLSVELDPPCLRAGAQHSFRAKVDLPPERLENVWIAVTSWPGDMPMTWDAELKKWVFEWTAPDRAMNILDVDRAIVWAVSREGHTSRTFSLPLCWLFAAPRLPEVERALESPWPHIREEARIVLDSIAVDRRQAPPRSRRSRER